MACGQHAIETAIVLLAVVFTR
ncbi:MAG: hypothetical protein E5X67_28015 [Mesorhizobium sp.]|nr:MAG: hypothetical protein EOS13_30500 [Mesorhizobium sp.]RWP14794.1 MAG: hypothetical protein EOR01_30800 [Mesorhizobium sp.]TIP24696.1 MAG: hypothetical protein E5X67_28015 [Mesorhizobium sp.]